MKIIFLKIHFIHGKIDPSDIIIVITFVQNFYDNKVNIFVTCGHHFYDHKVELMRYHVVIIILTYYKILITFGHKFFSYHNVINILSIKVI